MPKLLGLTACLSAIVIASTPTAAFSVSFSENQTIENLSQRAKLEVSKITGIAVNRLSVVNKATLANTGITRFKLRDSKGNIYGVSLDTAGNRISQEKLEQTI